MSRKGLDIAKAHASFLPDKSHNHQIRHTLLIFLPVVLAWVCAASLYLTGPSHLVIHQLLVLSGDVELNPGPLDQDQKEIEEILGIVDDKTFDDNDWNVVITKCSSLAAEWEQLSGYLGIPFKKIDIIKRNHPSSVSACWNEALKQWILQNYQTDKFDKPSWRSLLKAISQVDKLQFKKLAEKHRSQAKLDKSESDGKQGGAQETRVPSSKQATDEPASIVDLNPSTSPHFTFPLLNLKKMNEDEKERLHRRLFAETEKMESKFQELFKATRMSLVDRKVTVGRC